MGKTTCAAAYAVAAARRGRRVLAVSTDPAHSLGDALGVRLGPAVAAVSLGRRRSLQAVELDAPRAFRRWLAEHRRALGDIVEHGTWLDRADVDALLELSLPGIDELMGMLEIVRLAAPSRGGYEAVVVDTAPTGHALRLLSSPGAVRAAAEVLDALQQEHRIIRERLARIGRPEAADRLIERLAGQAAETAALLRDRAQSTFRWVTLPEEMAIEETADALRILSASGIHVDELIVNRVLPAGPPCRICDRRRAAEERALAHAGRTIAKGRRIQTVAALPKEPRGVAALMDIGGTLVDPPRRGSPAPSRRRAANRADMAFSSAPGGRGSLPVARLSTARLLFFGGKGGVGKTTTAAAAAVRLARADPASVVLLLSTDPAHSLADVFDAAVDDAAKPLAGGPRNLDVRELDAAAALAVRRGAIESALQELVDAVGAGIGVGSHRGVTELMDLAPPGIDELFGVLSVVEAQARYRTIVVDTAPTGHALRLLETPAAAREWLQVLLRVLLKYRGVVRPGQLAAELVALSREIRALQDLLRDRARTQFITVTRAAELPRRETERLLARLRRLRVPAPIVVVNARTLDPGACPHCRRVAAAEEREMRRLNVLCRRGASRCDIIQTPLAAPPPRGVAALERWSRTWIA